MTASAMRVPANEGAACTVPFFLVSQLVELVERWHIPAHELLSDAALLKTALEDPFARLPLRTMCELLGRARLLTGEPGLGYYDGLLTPAAHGTLGFAALSASTVRDALALLLRFGPLFSTALSLRMTVHGESTTLILEENVDLGDVRDIVLISTCLRLRTSFNVLAGQRRDLPFELAIAEPPYQSRFAHFVPRWRFGMPAHRLFFPTSMLDVPIATADRTGFRTAQVLCERALQELRFEDGLVVRVCGLLAKEGGGFRSVDEVAARMHVSGRTLKRRLAALDACFSDLIERARREKAIALLRSGRSVGDVARDLDYATASAFVRAFHRWTGTTPAAHRRGATANAGE